MDKMAYHIGCHCCVASHKPQARIRRNRHRADIMSVTGNACVYCGRYASTLDHIQPLSAGGGHRKCNLAPACQACNYGKADKPLGEWLRGR